MGNKYREESQELSVEHVQLGMPCRHSICNRGRDSGVQEKTGLEFYIWESLAYGWYLTG